jgi:hypothetical protein
MTASNRKIKILTPAIGIVAIGTLGLAPAVLSVAPASAATHSSSSSVRSGDYGGQATLKLPARPSIKMNLDDAYVSANQHAHAGRIDALMAKGSSYAEVNATYVRGRITGGTIHSDQGTSRIIRGSINGGKGISAHNRLVMKTTNGTVVVHLNLKKR